MDGNRELITENYLPFSVLSVGIVPVQVSAFMFGLFVGKALEKHNIKINSSSAKVDKNVMIKEIESGMNYYSGHMGENIRDLKERENNGNHK
jgi:hypothetical protein